jgi:mevalonate kinase
MKQVVASAPGNLFFFGEHAVVYGRPGIVTAVGRRTTVTARQRNDAFVHVNSDAFGKAVAKVKGGHLVQRGAPVELGILLELCERIVQRAKVGKGFEVHIKSDLPVKSGMSSSTAVLSAMLAAVTEVNGIHVDKRDYFDYLFPLQEMIHGGKASGSEIVSSALGGFNVVQKKEKKRKISFRHLKELPLKVVIANTRVPSPTALTVGYHVPSLIERDAEFVWDSFDEIARIAREGEKAVNREDSERIGELMNQNQEVLRNLGLSHPKLEDCIEAALRAGALGAKLSGSGWGGVCFALTRRAEEQQDAVAKAMTKTKAEIIKTEIGVKGVSVERRR